MGLNSTPNLRLRISKELVVAFKAIIQERLHLTFPQDPQEQLWERSAQYLARGTIPVPSPIGRSKTSLEEWGTAVTVQAMVFGNLGDDCATGVAFTRDLSTGENVLNGDFLVNAQGEDVVAGIRTPQQITLAASRERAVREGKSEEERVTLYPSMEERLPASFATLREITQN